jgi:hypothetical protein
LAPDFIIEFERVDDEEDYMLIWPEFRNPSDVSNPDVRVELAIIWGFLLEWADYDGFTVPRISEAYQQFLWRPREEQVPRPFPAGFPPIPEEAGSEQLAPALGEEMEM